MPLNARLVVVGGDVKTSEIKLRLPCTIGRGRGNTIMLPQGLVSRQHCEIFERDGVLVVRDLGSLNGTFVNNQRINDAAPLPANDLLTIGTVTFRAVYDLADDSATASEMPQAARTGDTLPDIGAKPKAAAAEAEEPVEAGGLPEFEQTSLPGEAQPPAAQLPSAAQTQPAPPLPAALPPAAQAPPSEPPAEEEEQESAGSDDDFQDFLKSLGKK